jgi:hypothetical protein
VGNEKLKVHYKMSITLQIMSSLCATKAERKARKNLNIDLHTYDRQRAADILFVVASFNLSFATCSVPVNLTQICGLSSPVKQIVTVCRALNVVKKGKQHINGEH